MHKPKNVLIYAILLIAGKCVMRLFIYLLIYMHIMRLYIMRKKGLCKEIYTKVHRQQYLCRQRRRIYAATSLWRMVLRVKIYLKWILHSNFKK